MKKVIALALALVLALSLGVSALAALKPIQLVGLDKVTSTNKGYTLISNDFDLFAYKAETPVIYVDDPAGGAYYVAIVLPKMVGTDSQEYKNFTFEKSGVVTSIEQIAYDPAKFTTNTTKDANGNYTLWDFVGVTDANAGTTQEIYTAMVDVEKVATPVADSELKKQALTEDELADLEVNATTYPGAKTRVDLYNKYIAGKANKAYIYCDSNIYLFKITVAENYGVAYADGYYKINGDLFVGGARKGTAMTTDEVKIVSDVAIFDYDRVTYAAENDVTLYVGDAAYSDYRSYLNTYMPEFKNLLDSDVFLDDFAMVVSTTEFRAITGKGLTVGYDAFSAITDAEGAYKTKGMVSVVIPEVVAGQKGVNFWMEYKENRSTAGKWGKLTALDINFKGADVISSAATVEVDLPYSNLELLNDFGKKVEEEDVVTYYILKDGKLAGQFTVDYLTADWDAQVKFDIPVKAGEALGKYTVALAVPAATTEENPNTGAESVIGVVAAMAAVSVVAAAAVSLKK